MKKMDKNSTIKVYFIKRKKKKNFLAVLSEPELAKRHTYPGAQSESDVDVIAE